MIKECIICYGESNLISYPKYYCKCKCKYYIHQKCLDKWNNDNNYCIICRQNNKIIIGYYSLCDVICGIAFIYVFLIFNFIIIYDII